MSDPVSRQELDHALARNATIHAELLGYGTSCDASHMTAPLATGHGAYLAMKRALGHAARSTRKVKPTEIDYINAHATGTALGDVAEVRAILSACEAPPARAPHGDAAPKRLNVSSTKGAIGHLLGAAGAVEAIFTILALKHGVLPPTVNLENVGVGEALASLDPNLGSVDELGTDREAGNSDDAEKQRLNVEIAKRINFVPHTAQHGVDLRFALTNSFGFGGTNASLCFGRWDGV